MASVTLTPLLTGFRVFFRAVLNFWLKLVVPCLALAMMLLEGNFVFLVILEISEEVIVSLLPSARWERMRRLSSLPVESCL